MDKWNNDGNLNAQVEKIKELKIKGNTNREILDKNEFCFEALKSCNIPISYLIPKIDGQEMTLQEWDTHTSSEYKWEYDGTPFCNADERDKILLGLLYSSGLMHLLDILPDQSKEELFKLVSNYNSKV